MAIEIIMRLLGINYLSVLLAWWAYAAATTDNNLTDLVSWDEYSLSINGSR